MARDGPSVFVGADVAVAIPWVVEGTTNPPSFAFVAAPRCAIVSTTFLAVSLLPVV